jgi:sporulation protein YlmC with PRC-barrel domain
LIALRNFVKIYRLHLGTVNARPGNPQQKEIQMTSINSPGSQKQGGARIVGSGVGEGPGPEIMAAATLDGNKVLTTDGEDVGNISDIMLDVQGGRIAYAVLKSGSFLGMGGTLYAIPWSALTLDTDNKCFHLDMTAQRIKEAPGFDKDHWPAFADEQWSTSVYSYYNRPPYWSEATAYEDDATTRPRSGPLV